MIISNNLSIYNLDIKLIFVYVVHILLALKKIVVNHKRNDIKEDTTVVNLLNALDDSSNELLLPFNYHKLFDMNLIWFDDKTGHMHFNIDFEDDLVKLGIYPTRIKSNIMNNKDVVKYLSIRKAISSKLVKWYLDFVSNSIDNINLQTLKNII